MDKTGKGTKATIVSLVLIAILLLIQNLLLVRRVDQHLATINRLTERLNQLSVLKTGDTAQAFSVVSMDNMNIHMDPKDWKQKVLLLAFTTRCGACVKNIDRWGRLLGRLAKEEVTAVGVSPDSVSQIKAYQRERSLRFPAFSILLDSNAIAAYKLFSYPQTILVDAGGIVNNVWVGVLDEDKIYAIQRAVRPVDRHLERHFHSP